MLKMNNMALTHGPVGFSEEIIAVFELKMSQIDTENNKNPKNFQFSMVFFAFFRLSVDRLRRLECFIGSTRKTLVVQKHFMTE